MFNTALDKFRDEPGKGLVTIIGVLMIVGLLWAIGHVARGQVQQAQARGDGQVRAQAMALRCAGNVPGTAGTGCDDRQTWSTGAEAGATGSPVYVSYR